MYNVYEAVHETLQKRKSYVSGAEKRIRRRRRSG